MAFTVSLGSHTPSALHHLRLHSLLPSHPKESDYRWHRYEGQDDSESEGEELLLTETAVAWSKAGIVQRVFNFEKEGEIVLDAVLTRFISRRERDLIQADQPSRGTDEQSQQDESVECPLERAVVVLLNTQLHIFLLQGGHHIVRVPFDVLSISAAPIGIFAECKVPAPIHEVTPRKPSRTSLPDKYQPPTSSTITKLRVCTLLDPFSSFTPLQTRTTSSSIVTSASHGNPAREYGPISYDERLLFVSPYSQRHQATGEGRRARFAGPHLVVTQTGEAGPLSIWQLDYILEPPKRRRRTNQHAAVNPVIGNGSVRIRPASEVPEQELSKAEELFTTKSRASFGPRKSVHKLRESLGSRLAPSLSETADDIPDDRSIISELDPELVSGPQLKRSSRRVSSLMARADVSANPVRQDAVPAERGQAADRASAALMQSSLLRPRRARSSHRLSVRTSIGTLIPEMKESGLESASVISDSPPQDRASGTMSRPAQKPTSRSHVVRHAVLTPLKQFSMPRSSASGDGTRHSRRRYSSVFVRDDLESDLENPSAPQIVRLYIHDASTEHMVRASLGLRRIHTDAALQGADPGIRIISPDQRGEPMLDRTLFDSDISRETGILGLTKVITSGQQRVALLRRTPGGSTSLTLISPHVEPRAIEPPSRFLISEQYNIGSKHIWKSLRTSSAKRVFRENHTVIGLSNGDSHGNIDLEDNEGQVHRIHLSLGADETLVEQLIQSIARASGDNRALQEYARRTWWSIRARSKSLETTSSYEPEWMAIIILMFHFMIPSLREVASHPLPPTEMRRRSALRSSSGSLFEYSASAAMAGSLGGSEMSDDSWYNLPVWSSQQVTAKAKSQKRMLSGGSTTKPPASPSKTARRPRPPQNDLFVSCFRVAHELLLKQSSPAERSSLAEMKNLVPHIIQCLRELGIKRALDGRTNTDEYALRSLRPLMMQLHLWISLTSSIELEEQGRIISQTQSGPWRLVVAQLRDPPTWPSQLNGWSSYLCSAAHDLRERLASASRRSGRLETLAKGDGLHSSTFVFSSEYSELRRLSRKSEEFYVQQSGSTKRLADSTTTTTARSTEMRHQEGVKKRTTAASTHPGDRALDDEPDELRLVPQTRDQPRSEAEALLTPDRDDRLEKLLGASGLRLANRIFTSDGRLRDAELLHQADRGSTAAVVADETWSEADLLEAEKAMAQIVAQRTLASAAIAGSMSFSLHHPLLTEKWIQPGWVLSCVMRPSGNSVSADKQLYDEDKITWAYFHQGASNGLRISREAKGLDSSWLQYNKPERLTNRHAGFLLALGLNGHLKTLARWIAFNYLTPKHTMTTCGLLLGHAASHLGTMDTLVTRILTLHIARTLPRGSAQLNLSAITQTSGMFGLGLVYAGTQHRRTSEIMLSEIERPNEAVDNVNGLEAPNAESYRLAAGFALGLVNLGGTDQGSGVRDLLLQQRLLRVAVGPSTVNQIQSADKSTAAAIMAIAMMYMKSENQALANKLELPKSDLQLDFLRADLYLLRALARDLILWHQIQPTREWVNSRSQLSYDRRSVRNAEEALSSRNIPKYAIAAGSCFALALKHAGTCDSVALHTLVAHLDLFAELAAMEANSFDTRLTRNQIHQCLNLLALCASIVAAGSGDVLVLRRLRYLHARTHPDITFGSHLAASMAVGFLFLGGGAYTFGRSDLAIAGLLVSCYPIFPNNMQDCDSHLQSLRWMWTLAAKLKDGMAGEMEARDPTGIEPSLPGIAADGARAVAEEKRQPSPAKVDHALRSPRRGSPTRIDQQSQPTPDAPSLVHSANQDTGVGANPFAALLKLPLFQHSSRRAIRSALHDTAGATGLPSMASLELDEDLLMLGTLERARQGNVDRTRLERVKVAAEGLKERDGEEGRVGVEDDGRVVREVLGGLRRL